MHQISTKAGGTFHNSAKVGTRRHISTKAGARRPPRSPRTAAITGPKPEHGSWPADKPPALQSVVNFDVPPPTGCEQLHINIEDSEDANLLDHLEDAVEFIDEAADDDGKVLVHCQNGVSRSAAVVLAYMCYGMGLSVSEALETLKVDSPSAQPNAGFMRQLELFQSMGCEIDEDNEGYKRFQLMQRALQWQEQGNYIDEQELKSVTDSLDVETLSKVTVYRCRKCRQVLATSRNTVEVEEGAGQSAFPFRKRDVGARAAAGGDVVDAGCLFVEPLRWMQGLYKMTGKLYCPSCNAKLGLWNWAGMQTPTGTWVTPAFFLHRSKLDAFKPVPLKPVAPAPAAKQAPACRAIWFKYLIFDCDGVLVDTERASCEALRRAILNVTGDFYPVIGMTVQSCIEYYNATLAHGAWDVASISKEVARAKEGLYKTLTADGIAAFDGARALALEAKAAGIKLGVGSSGSPEKIRHNLESAGLLDLFEDEFIVSGQTVPQGKPAPDVYLEVLKRLGCENSKYALIVEDAVHGLEAAKGAGAYAVGIANTLPKERLKPVADLVVSNLTDIDIAGMSP